MYRKKIIGSSVFFLVIGVVILSSFSFARAQFISSSSSLTFDAIVASVGIASITLHTPGTTPITVDTTERTIFSSGIGSMADLAPGMRVYVIAREQQVGNPIARIVRGVSTGPGYGTTGDSVIVSHATVVGTAGTTLTVDTGTTLVTFHVTSSTLFLGKHFFDLVPGDVVNVIGEDSGSVFVARSVAWR